MRNGHRARLFGAACALVSLCIIGCSKAPVCKVSPVELEELREDISVIQKDLKSAQDRQQALAADLAAKQATLETKRATPDELRRKLEAIKKGAGRTEKAKTDTKAGTPKKGTS